MIVTREIDYAFRILRRLQDGNLTATPEICRRENLPIHFVYRILKKLDIAGFVDITRGKDGGAKLACDLDTITVYELIEALGERKYVSSCTRSGYECEYRLNHNGRCGVHNNLTAMQNDLDNLLKSKTLLQMIREA
jgi:Rrf2 family protein